MGNRTRTISGSDITRSVADALQYISYYHPPDYIRSLSEAYTREQSPSAKNAIGQILLNSRMAAFGRRPICQDTGLVVVFAKVGMDARIKSTASFADLVNEGVRQAYLDPDNPLRVSIVADPLARRVNTRDNTPAVVHVDLVQGNQIEITIAAKGGGSENKARFTTLNPSASVSDWVVNTVSTLGSGWCPPGLISVGIGGSAEKAMLLAKEAMNEPIDMAELIARGAISPEEGLRIELYERINALGIGAQGLGGLTTVVDVKVATYPTHAASKPVALIPQCAANRHLKFTLDGSGPISLQPPDLREWPDIGADELNPAGVRRVNLDSLTNEETASWRCGETLLLSGKILTGRDAAHKRMIELLDAGKPLPVDLRGRVIYYVGPVRAVRNEVVGPAGPTTSSRLDDFTDKVLAETGLFAMVGKAERGPAAIESIVRHKTPYLAAVGGAAYLISKSIKAARIVAFEDLGMEAIYEFDVQDMPVIMAVDVEGNSIHNSGPLEWRKRMAADSIARNIGV
ncbi:MULTISPECIES: fumarate hydratase [unclassified Mesorhizobium]|uniref:fumarate hydratase n=1 Tax=unclassified Mesorhizobium TaxID=325217 RepID=UPI000FC9A93A|nr:MULTISPECIES: fumarate hydratase [unclassified Mesorhizobium]RVC47510.1 fumarate hydratase [Mesorhizobium sp. M4A.F.Ca.ET.090.04.2.1]RWD53722.1 MAG: fumarate hydratase [Mesorhizobium sp.]RWJ22606.1 MAG: fumarate hydratase [Mesorhizobium sp.]RWN15089.1 MAG: fumarate hydratase [Mesorhizobium sp.]RWN20997.1 MAG: fumarate hydratase [Mesorhizobium sp.]